jgi:hypothetical protein
MLLFFVQILSIPRYSDGKCWVRWDGISQILKLSFRFGHPCYLFSHLLIHRRGPAAAQHWPTFFPDLHVHLSVFLARLGLHELRCLLHLCMELHRSRATRRMVGPFCWSDSVGPCHKQCRHNTKKHLSSRDSHLENLSSSSESDLCNISAV